MKSKEIYNPRCVLQDSLERIGLPRQEAWLIALETGGQGIIDRGYLSSRGIKLIKRTKFLDYELVAELHSKTFELTVLEERW